MSRPFALLLLLVAGCGPRLAEVERTEFAFGSYVRMRALAPGRTQAGSATQLAFRELHRLDTLWSAFLAGSEVARLNQTSGGPVSTETRELVTAGLEFCRWTGGALDITIQPLVETWGFLGGEQRVPDSAALAALLARVDYRKVRVCGDSVLLLDGAALDLGAIAVGFAVDRAVEILHAAGVRQGLVDAGGDIRVFGDRVWRVGLQDPRGSGVIRVFELKNRAVSTSGDYQKFFSIGGQRYHHILDPRTGYPAGECVSATVLAPSSLTADAYSTAVFILGPERGLDLVSRLDSLTAVIYVVEGDSVIGSEIGADR